VLLVLEITALRLEFFGAELRIALFLCGKELSSEPVLREP
jgi:hypothetical protein